MAWQRDDLHAQQVEIWKSKNSGLSEKELSRLFMNGVLAVRRQSLGTLSNVTVTVVVDRVLLECQERFPVLAEIKNDAAGLHFDQFSDCIEDSKSQAVNEALQELLVDILEVFGKITADILTKNLHRELMTVSHQTLASDLQPQAAQSSVLAKKNRDPK